MSAAAWSVVQTVVVALLAVACVAAAYWFGATRSDRRDALSRTNRHYDRRA